MREARIVGGIALAFVIRLFAFISFIVGFVVRLAIARTGFLPDLFPVSGVDSVCRSFMASRVAGFTWWPMMSLILLARPV